MNSIRAKIGPSGRLVIPASMRRELGLKTGDDVVLRLEQGELRVAGVAQAIARAQAVVRRAARGRTLSEELMADRRAEAEG